MKTLRIVLCFVSAALFMQIIGRAGPDVSTLSEAESAGTWGAASGCVKMVDSGNNFCNVGNCNQDEDDYDKDGDGEDKEMFSRCYYTGGGSLEFCGNGETSGDCD
jgi:hypothetical protein